MNENSKYTAIDRSKSSYPLRILLKKGLIKGTVLDYGCGHGKDYEFLIEKGFNADKFDPYFYPEVPTKKYDTIICFYVLNVLPPEEQKLVYMKVSSLLKSGGKAYYAVRRDIKTEGYRIHKVHKKETYQTMVYLNQPSIFLNDNCEIYEYEHYSTRNKGNYNLSPFLSGEDYRIQITETEKVFAFYDKYPVSEGHSLVVPKKKVSSYFELSQEEQFECWEVVNEVKKTLQTQCKPDGFNIGINVDESAGQTVFHCHIHIIPRYKGDVKNPRGGVRGVIPSKKNY